MKNFLAGVLLSALFILGWQKLISQDEITTSKDTITVKMKDQLIHLPDTIRKDSAK